VQLRAKRKRRPAGLSRTYGTNIEGFALPKVL
jgi:hypothetical protein